MAYKNKEDQNAAWYRWYEKNKKKKQAWQKKRRDLLRSMMKELKSKLRCGRCGESHPACLDFHHRKGTKKVMNIADMLNRGWGPKKIQEEINKCEVVCSNCHRKEHYGE